MKIRIKKTHPDAIVPRYANPLDAGLDLTAVSKDYDKAGNIVYGTGLAMEIPEGYVGLVFPRSSNSKTALLLTNSVGVIDAGYRGEIMFKYRRYAQDPNIATNYRIGDRVGQIIVLPYPAVEFEVVEQLTVTERGEGGYGSTGS